MRFDEFYILEADSETGEFSSAHDFLKHHYTGFIKQSHYDDMKFDMDIKKTPIVVGKMKIKSGEQIEFRQTGEKLKYTKTDKDGNPIRDTHNKVFYRSDEENIKDKLPLTDTTIYVFNSKDENIGYASDEFGADGVWIRPDYQRFGIGTELLSLFRKQFNDNTRKIGQMTPAGIKMTKSYWRKKTGTPKPDVNKIIEKFKSFLKTYDDSDDSKDDREINDQTPEYLRALIRFEYTISPDEKDELGEYFYPSNYKPIISVKDFYNKYKP